MRYDLPSVQNITSYVNKCLREARKKAQRNAEAVGVNASENRSTLQHNSGVHNKCERTLQGRRNRENRTELVVECAQGSAVVVGRSGLYVNAERQASIEEEFNAERTVQEDAKDAEGPISSGEMVSGLTKFRPQML